MSYSHSFLPGHIGPTFSRLQASHEVRMCELKGECGGASAGEELEPVHELRELCELALG